jgi:signal recognition particle GTPase
MLINSPGRRRRVAQGAGRTEGEVQELMGAFAAMKVQATNMGRMMKMQQPGGWGDE